MGLDMEIRHNGEEAIYMRKVNCVRKWCAENLENFEDNGLTNFPKEKFRELIGTMRKTIIESGLSNIYGYYQCIQDGWFEDDDWDLYKEVKAFLDVQENHEKLVEVASRLFPTSSGFFFGGTEYGEWYVADLIIFCYKFTAFYEELDKTEEWDEGTVEYWEWY
jgi:hypothetical protein